MPFGGGGNRQTRVGGRRRFACKPGDTRGDMAEMKTGCKRHWGRLAVAGLAVVMSFAWGACKEKDKLRLLLTARSVESAERFDLVVADTETGERLLENRDVELDADHDLTAEPLRLRVEFVRRGRYLVYLAAHTEGRPDQVYAERLTVKGIVERDVLLVSLEGADADGDGFVAAADCGLLEEQGGTCAVTDCDDTQAAVGPLMEEICGDGIDQNCDGKDPECADADGDGWTEDEDCDDNDPERNPGNTEYPNHCPTPDFPDGVQDPRCGDGIDQDCDGIDLPCLPDGDCDGWTADEDCNDDDPTVHPGAAEICRDPSGVDEDCDGLTDEGCVACDLDGDGFQRLDGPQGCPDASYQARGLPTDCNDFDAQVFPGLTETFLSCAGQEGGMPGCGVLALCDGIDNDCDGTTDEGCPQAAGLPPECDADGDGFLNPAVAGCSPEPGYEDCDDADLHVFPGAPDRCGDGILQNCNFDTECHADSDGDGYNRGPDCNDGDPRIHPWALEVCDGRDNDCDGVTDEGNPDANGDPIPPNRYCNDDNDGICGVPPPSGGGMSGQYCNPDYSGPNSACFNPPHTGTGRCVCSPVQPGSTRDEQNRVMCAGEDLDARASPRCFFAPQPEAKDDCAGGIDEDCRPDTSDGSGSCVGETPDCCPDLAQCVNTQTDFEHCGGCGYVCPDISTNRCVGGECRCGTDPPCEPGSECRPVGNDPADAECGCGPNTCPGGCCDGATCVLIADQDDGRCGSGGEVCNDCLAQGLDCNGTGQCICAAGSNCNGCCAGPQECQQTPDDSQCGLNGQPCVDCLSQGLDCVSGGAQCECVAGGNCAGCCAGLQDCQSGGAHTQCGINGQACVDCGLCAVCGANGSCQDVSAGADPRNQCAAESETTCGQTGACDGNGACQYWPVDTVCGASYCDVSVFYFEDTCSGPYTCQDSGSVDCVAYRCTTVGCRFVCANSGHCAPGYYCEGTNCVPKKPLGQTCNDPVECTSGNCVDGYCCNGPCGGVCEACNVSGALGTCTSYTAGSDPDDECPAQSPCGLNGHCNGNSACAYWPVGTLCDGASCVGHIYYPADTCSGPNNCPDSGSVNCTPYVCNASGCLTSCATHSDCAPNHYCLGGDCWPEKPTGQTCNNAFECSSGNCVDGYCCDSACGGTCRACDVAGDEGTCTLHTANTDPEDECAGSCQSCDGNGACHPTGSGFDPKDECTQQAPCGQNGYCDGDGACDYWAAGTECSTAQCVGNVFHFADVCDGAQNCLDSGTEDCGNYVCTAAGCPTTCGDDLDCISGYFCIGTSCEKKPDGYTCGDDSECAGGDCVDGYCCDTQCDGVCEACNRSGVEGTCSYYDPDTDPETECGGNCRSCNGAGACADTTAGEDPENDCAAQAPCGLDGECDGAGACGYWDAGTVCDAVHCEGDVLHYDDTCDAAHNCANDGGTLDCSPYTCSGAACLTSCTGDGDCASGFTCDASNVCS